MRYIKRILITIQCFFIKLTSFIFIMFGMVKNKKTQHVNDVIVSFTSFGVRVKKTAWLAAYSMLNQSIHPDKIILYLDNNNWNENNIPFILRKLQKLGIEIRFCEDIKPHKKYFFTMKSFPNNLIITVDDDFWYSKKLIEKLYDSYLKHPKAVSCMHCTQMQKDKDNNFLPYTKWTIADETDKERFDYFPIGVGGVLYPPNSLNKEVFNLDNIKKLCLFADDIWLKAMELLNKTPVVLVEMTKKSKYIPASQEVALWKTNLNESKNDKQLNDVFNFYNNFLGEKENLFNMIFPKL